MPAIEVIFHRLAARKYLTARRWYARRGGALAAAFRAAVDRAVQQIAEDPQRWPKYGAKHRWVRTRRFPYLLFYHILDKARVLVVAVAHRSRRPGYWRRRKRP